MAHFRASAARNRRLMELLAQCGGSARPEDEEFAFHDALTNTTTAIVLAEDR